MKQKLSNLEEIAAFRQSVYEMFSECFLASPSAERLPFLADVEWQASASALLGSEIQELCSDLAQSTGSSRLAVEHAALFLVPGPRQTFPFETVYREKQLVNGKTRPGRMMGHTALQVQRAYVQWGLPADLGTDELPDHAGVELRFMSLLAAAERLVRDASDGISTASVVHAEADFLVNHISQWFPQWLERVRLRARLPFYSSAAGVLASFLATDRQTLERLSAVSLVWAD